MENTSNTTSEQELLKMRDEGKISEEEYEQLLSAMRNKSNPEKELQLSSGSEFNTCSRLAEFLNKQNKKIPNLLWIALVSLAAMVLIKIAYASKAGPLILIDASLSAILLIGLYLGHKWAYVTTIIFVFIGTLSGFAKNPSYGLEIFCIDSLVLIPVLFCTKYFFQNCFQSENKS